MNANQRALWMSAVLSIAGVVFAAASLAVAIVVLLSPVDQLTPALTAQMKSVNRSQLLASSVSLVGSIFCIAQLIGGEPWMKRWIRPASGSLLALSTIFAVLLGLFVVSNMYNQITRGVLVAPTPWLRSNGIGGVSLGLGLLSIVCFTPATLWFIRWWQTTPRGEEYMRSSRVAASS